MKDRQGSLLRQQESQNPSTSQTRSSDVLRFSYIELPSPKTSVATTVVSTASVPVGTTVTSTTTVPAVTAPTSTTPFSAAPRLAGQKRSAEEYDEDVKRLRNGTVLAPPKTFSFPALPPTSFRHALPSIPRFALPPTSFHPGAFTPAASAVASTTSAATPAKALTRSSTATSTAQQRQRHAPVRAASRQAAIVGPSVTTVATCTPSAPSKGTKGVAGGGKASPPGTTARGKGQGGGGDGGQGFNFDMMDVMGYVDSDLLDEASGLFKFGSRAASRRSSSDFRSEHGSGASTTAQEFMDEDLLAALVARIAGREHQLTVDPEVIAYLALATKQRLRVMAERMIHASQHRRKSMVPLSPPTMYDVGHPMLRIEIGQHVKNQLLAIERVEREEELKRKEQVAELHRQNLAASRANVKGILRNADQTGKGGKKTVRFQFGSSLKGKAKLKEPKVVATEEQEFKFANQAALAFAGTRGKKASYAWMTAGGGVLKRPSTLAESDSTIDGALDPLSSLFMFGAGGVLGRSVDGLCGVNIPPVSVKDALFCLEHDDGSGGTGLKVLIKSYVKWKHTPLSSSRLQ